MSFYVCFLPQKTNDYQITTLNPLRVPAQSVAGLLLQSSAPKLSETETKKSSESSLGACVILLDFVLRIILWLLITW